MQYVIFVLQNKRIIRISLFLHRNAVLVGQCTRRSFHLSLWTTLEEAGGGSPQLTDCD